MRRSGASMSTSWRSRHVQRSSRRPWRSYGSSDHPKEGETGDFFVDAAGHLWFCKDPGTWAKLV
jgi:hypothetical protein